MSTDAAEVFYRVEERVATITLDRPEKLNAWTPRMAEEARAAFARADADEDVRAIVLTGAGRGFCSGADMSRLSSAAAGTSELPPAPASLPDGLQANFAQRYSYILAVKKPVIAAINAGGGRGLRHYAVLRHSLHGRRRQADHRLRPPRPDR